MTKLCDECETVAHCMTHGCIPKQQAFDKKAENARELGLDYEPAQQEPLRVAKVGQRVHGPELLPPSVWRYHLRRLAYWVLMAILGMLWLAFLVACTYAYAN